MFIQSHVGVHKAVLDDTVFYDGSGPGSIVFPVHVVQLVFYTTPQFQSPAKNVFYNVVCVCSLKKKLPSHSIRKDFQKCVTFVTLRGAPTQFLKTCFNFFFSMFLSQSLKLLAKKNICDFLVIIFQKIDLKTFLGEPSYTIFYYKTPFHLKWISSMVSKV